MPSEKIYDFPREGQFTSSHFFSSKDAWGHSKPRKCILVGKRLMGGQNVSCDFLGGKRTIE